MPSLAVRLLTYGALLVLLAASVALTAFDVGPWRVGAHLAIAAVQVGLVFGVFMQLGTASGLVRIMGMGGVLWLAIMFGFTLLDYAHR